MRGYQDATAASALRAVADVAVKWCLLGTSSRRRERPGHASAFRGGCRVKRPGGSRRREVGDELPIRRPIGLSSHSGVILGADEDGSSHHKLTHRIREWFVRQPHAIGALGAGAGITRMRHPRPVRHPRVREVPGRGLRSGRGRPARRSAISVLRLWRRLRERSRPTSKDGPKAPGRVADWLAMPARWIRVHRSYW